MVPCGHIETFRVHYGNVNTVGGRNVSHFRWELSFWAFTQVDIRGNTKLPIEGSTEGLPGEVKR